MNIECIRINSNELFNLKKYFDIIITTSGISIYYEKTKLNSNNVFFIIRSVDKIDNLFSKRYLRNKLVKQINDQLLNEVEHAKIAFFLAIGNSNLIFGDYKGLFPNKIEQLILASQMGFLIPETIITNNKKLICNKIDKNKIVTKCIDNHIFFHYKKFTFGQYTEEITNENVGKLSDFFHPSLFQNKIEKKYEVKVFFLKNKTYSIAIFSNKDDCDYRKSLFSNTRYIPFCLPIDIEEKIVRMLKKLLLNSGTIDFIVDEYDNFIFLEINPFGQFGFISSKCNYNIEKEICKNVFYE